MRSGLLFLLAAALIVSSLLMGGGSARSSPDLLLNEGFEDGVGDWTTNDGDLSVSLSVKHGGSKSLQLSSSYDLNIHSPPISVQAGAAYSLSLFVSGPAIDFLHVRILWTTCDGPVTFEVPLVEYDGSWERFAIDGAPPSDATSATILILNDPGEIFVDDVEFSGSAPDGSFVCPTETPSETETPTPTAAVATPTRAPSRTPSPVPTTGIGSILINGDFEDADGDALSGWSKYGGELWQTSEHYRSGEHSGAFSSTSDSTKWVYQALTVSGGAAYQFGIYVLLNDSSGSEVFLRISWYESGDAGGGAIATSDSPAKLTGADPSFRYLSTGAVLSPPTASSARFRVMLVPASSAQTTVYLDDASVQQVSPDLAATPSPPVAVGDETGPDNAVEEVNSPKQAVTATESAMLHQGESPFPLKINEVMYDPGQSDDETASEWVEIYNAGDSAVDLAGWTLADNSESDKLTPLIVPAHGFAVIAASERFREEYPAFKGGLLTFDGRIGNGLADKGDRLLLYDPSGLLADGISWGDDVTVLNPSVALVASGHSVERAPAGRDSGKASDFVDNAKPSPGQGMAKSEVAGTSAEKKVVDDVASSLQQSEQTSSGHDMSRWLVLLAAGAALATAVWLVVVYRQRLHLKK